MTVRPLLHRPGPPRRFDSLWRERIFDVLSLSDLNSRASEGMTVYPKAIQESPEFMAMIRSRYSAAYYRDIADIQKRFDDVYRRFFPYQTFHLDRKFDIVPRKPASTTAKVFREFYHKVVINEI